MGEDKAIQGQTGTAQATEAGVRTDLLAQGAKVRTTTAWLPLVARLALGAVFIYMGVHKVRDPSQFLHLVELYHLTNNYVFLNTIAAALPWFEIFCGLLLILGIAVRGTALVVLGMLLPFSIVVFKRALMMAATQGLAFCAVKFDCGCGAGEIVICNKLIENGGLMLVSIWLISCQRHKWSVRDSLFGP